MTMNNRTALIDEFNRYKAGDAGLFDSLSNRLLVLAIEYATRSEQRNPTNPFVSDAVLIKTLLDEDRPLFEYVYLSLADAAKIASLLADHDQWVSEPCFLPERPHWLLHKAEFSGACCLPDVASVDHGQLREMHEQSLKENDDYVRKHPNTRWLRDLDNARIWTRQLPNEGRRRAYWLNAPKAPQLLHELMNDDALRSQVAAFTGAPVECESILFEELSATELSIKKRDWHIDKLADQIKVFIPLEDVDEESGPTYWIAGTLPEDLVAQDAPRSHLHYSYIYSGMVTTNANFIPRDAAVIDESQEQAGIFGPGQMLFLDTRLIHSGSLCAAGRKRITMTLTYRVRSLRNEALASIPSLYA